MDGASVRIPSAAYAIGYLLVVLALGEDARWSGPARWAAIVALAAVPAGWAAIGLAVPPEHAALGFFVRVLSPVSLAGARWLASRDESLGDASRVLLGALAVALVVQVAADPAFVSQGIEDLFTYNLLVVIGSTLLLGAMVTLTRDVHVALRRLGLAGALVGAFAMGALLWLEGLRPGIGLLLPGYTPSARVRSTPASPT